MKKGRFIHPATGDQGATRRISASEADDDIPIIAITSFAMYGDRSKILDAGCTAYFEKPIDPLTIVEKIHVLLGLAGNNTTVNEEH